MNSNLVATSSISTVCSPAYVRKTIWIVWFWCLFGPKKTLKKFKKKKRLTRAQQLQSSWNRPKLITIGSIHPNPSVSSRKKKIYLTSLNCVKVWFFSFNYKTGYLTPSTIRTVQFPLWTVLNNGFDQSTYGGHLSMTITYGAHMLVIKNIINVGPTHLCLWQRGFHVLTRSKPLFKII